MRWLLHCAAVPVVFVLAAAALLAEHDPVSFAVQDRVRLLDSVLQGAPSSLFTSIRSGQRRRVVEAAHCAAAWIFTLRISFGTGTCFVPTFVLLICVGLFPLFGSTASLSAPS